MKKQPRLFALYTAIFGIGIFATCSAWAGKECINEYGKTACGYNCVAEGGEVQCADRPDQECLADYGEIACGYGCASGYGQVRCSHEKGGFCKADKGEIACSEDF